MRFCLDLLGDKQLGACEFYSAYECEKYIQIQGFTPYIFAKQTCIFRKITNKVDTCFARSTYEKGVWRAQYSMWPEKRVIVKLAACDYKMHAMEIIEYLQNHPDGLTQSGGIIEPKIFSSTIIDNDKEERYTIFTFLNKNFAAEFKLIWG